MTIYYFKRNITWFFAIITISFALAQFSTSWLSLSVAQFWVEHDSVQYIARQKLNFSRGKSRLSTFVFPYTCSSDVRHRLNKIDYSEPEIRFVGLVLDERNLCSADGILSHNIDLQPITYPLLRYISEATSQEEIAVIIKGVSNKFIVFLNKVRLKDHFSLYCQTCMFYQLKLNNEAPPPTQNSTWFTVIHDYGQAKGFLHVSKVLKKQIDEDYFWIYFLMYCVAFSLIIIIYKLYISKKQNVNTLLIQAAQKRQFIPFYQVIVTPNGEVKGVEALMRWQDNSGEILTPNVFIDTAEKLGVIDEMTFGMIQKAKDDFKYSGQDVEFKSFFCAFNLTASQIESDDFIDNLLSIFLDYSGFIPAFEITERQEFNDKEAAKRNIKRLQSCGYQIKLDDAGTGYGGFSYFLNFNIDTIKIDKMFVDIIGHEDFKINVLNAIIEMAKSLELTIIAEGVETQEQVDYLSEKKVDLLQGYYFSKPVPYHKLNITSRLSPSHSSDSDK